MQHLPVCFLVCMIRAFLVLADQPQDSHKKGRSDVCFVSCSCKVCIREKESPHILPVNKRKLCLIMELLVLLNPDKGIVFNYSSCCGMAKLVVSHP